MSYELVQDVARAHLVQKVLILSRPGGIMIDVVATRSIYRLNAVTLPLRHCETRLMFTETTATTSLISITNTGHYY